MNRNTCKRITEQLKTTLREVISLSIMDHKNVLRYYDAWIEPTWINQFTNPSSNNNNNNNISKFNMKREREKKYVNSDDDSNRNPIQLMNFPFNECSDIFKRTNDNNDINEDEGEEDGEGEEEESEEEDDDVNRIVYNNEINFDYDNSSRVEVLESTDTQSTATNKSTLTTTNISMADYKNNKMNDIIFEQSSDNTTSNSSNLVNSNNSVVFDNEPNKNIDKSNYGDDEGDGDENDENSKLDKNENDNDNESTTSSLSSSSSSGPPIEAININKKLKNENKAIDEDEEKKNINNNVNTHKYPSPLLMPCDLVHFTNSKSPPFHLANEKQKQKSSATNTPISSDIIPYQSPIYKLKFELSLYIQSEYCEGTNLGRYLYDRMDKPNRKVNSIELYEFLVQIMEGLEHIHSKGIIHRDMKPENIFITNEKKIKIGDFGLATFNCIIFIYLFVFK